VQENAVSISFQISFAMSFFGLGVSQTVFWNSASLYYNSVVFLITVISYRAPAGDRSRNCNDGRHYFRSSCFSKRASRLPCP
jgi:hypothetical protein